MSDFHLESGMCMKFVRQIYMYLQVRQFFPHGYEPQGWLCCGRDGINSTFYGTNPIFGENDQ